MTSSRRPKVMDKAAEIEPADLTPVIEEIPAKGVTSQIGIARELNAQGHAAPRGGS